VADDATIEEIGRRLDEATLAVEKAIQLHGAA